MIIFNINLKEYVFLNLSTHTLHLNEPFGVNMEHLCPLFNAKNKIPKIPGVKRKYAKITMTHPLAHCALCISPGLAGSTGRPVVLTRK